MFYRVHLLCNVWLAPLALLFIRIMVRMQDSFSRRLIDLSLFISISSTLALLFHYDAIYPFILYVVYFSPTFIIFQIFHLMWIDRRLRRGFRRLPKLPTVGFARRNLIYLGGILVLLTSVMDHAPWMGPVIPALGNLGLTIYLFFLSQAISQQRLLNFEALLSRILVLIAVAFTLTGVYSLLVAWIQNSPGLFFLNSFIASFLILMLLDPLRALVGYFTQRLLTKKHQKLQIILRDAQRKLTGIVDLSSFSQTLLSTVEQTLQPKHGALFVLRTDGTKYRRIKMIGADMPGAPVLREILFNHPLLHYCRDLHRRDEIPILLDQIFENEIDRSASRDQRSHYTGLLQAFKALDSNLLIPLFDSGQIIGFVTLYAPLPPEPWGSNWGLLPILYPYFEQAARTLRNLEVFVRQREKERLAALGEMAAGLAHEIRNPLGAIKGAAQYLDPALDRPESKFLKIIIEEVDRLNQVVMQFLDYSKPHSLEFKTVDIGPLVQKTIDLLKPSLPTGIQLEFSQSTKPTLVSAVPEQIQQVLLNLIQNSIKALENVSDGKVRVCVDGDGEEYHREVSILVEDNGKGIKREHLDKIFIPFFTTSPSGTGLGLPICQKIIEAHRGRIDVISEEGKQTRFYVILPFALERDRND